MTAGCSGAGTPEHGRAKAWSRANPPTLSPLPFPTTLQSGHLRGGQGLTTVQRDNPTMVLQPPRPSPSCYF